MPFRLWPDPAPQTQDVELIPIGLHHTDPEGLAQCCLRPDTGRDEGQRRKASGLKRNLDARRKKRKLLLGRSEEIKSMEHFITRNMSTQHGTRRSDLIMEVL